MKKTHIIDIRVYFEDTDAGGVVYYANYLKFAERARTEALRAAGIESSRLRETEGVLFVVRHVEADYLKPAMLDDLLSVRTTVKEIKGASFTLLQEVVRNETPLVLLKITLVCVSDAFKPAKLPESAIKALASLQENS